MSLAPQRSRLQLGAHVRACRIEGQVILLDLKANRYIGVAAAACEDWLPRVEGRPRESSAAWRNFVHPPLARTEACTGRPSLDATTAQLVSQGLLTVSTSAPGAPCAPAISLVEPSACLDLGDIGTPPSVCARQLGCFVGSALRATWWLRTRSLHAIVHIVEQRRRRHPDRPQAPLAQMTQAAVLYERLRPLLFSAHEQCLFDSLALINFLATQGLFPHWVIGVRTAPFGAHAWVQAGATVLNDQHAYVRAFVPLLVV